MNYEDLRGFCMQKHDYILQLLEQIDDLKFDIRKLKEEVEKLKGKVTDKNEEIEK